MISQSIAYNLKETLISCVSELSYCYKNTCRSLSILLSSFYDSHLSCVEYYEILWYRKLSQILVSKEKSCTN